MPCFKKISRVEAVCHAACAGVPAPASRAFVLHFLRRSSTSSTHSLTPLSYPRCSAEQRASSVHWIFVFFMRLISCQ